MNVFKNVIFSTRQCGVVLLSVESVCVSVCLSLRQYSTLWKHWPKKFILVRRYTFRILGQGHKSRSRSQKVIVSLCSMFAVFLLSTERQILFVLCLIFVVRFFVAYSRTNSRKFCRETDYLTSITSPYNQTVLALSATPYSHCMQYVTCISYKVRRQREIWIAT